jgi:AcrR family transcriptional regulator
MPEEVLSPRKLPRQPRSAATVEVILEAATRVLSQESLAGFNTNRIAQVAGVSVGSLYQYFPNKSALVAALVARAQSSLTNAVERCIAQSQGKALVDVLAELIEVAIEYQFGNPVFAAALDHEERRLPLDAVLTNAQERMVTAVQSLLEQHRNEIAAPIHKSAAADCLVIAKALVESEASHSSPDIDGLRMRVLRALQGYLLLEP